VLATDGSASAAEAEQEAIQLAQVLGVTLLAVSVAHLPQPGAAYGGADVVSSLMEAEEHRIEKVLASVTENAEAAGVRCLTFAVDGVAVDEIGRVASDRDAQLIVVGSHGWGAARRLLSGSVSTGLVHRAPWPRARRP
jgi:nucleotide-binding universal stress UspA family protein